MHFLDLTLPAPADNLALDEALLLQAEQSGPNGAGEVLRLWEWPRPAVVLGAGCRLAEDVNEAACLADGVPILRRSSGGGTVLLGAGCLCYSLVLRFERHPALNEIGTSYRFILARLLEALAVPAGEQAGISDLASAGRKFSGNAQQRKRDHLLHHGTILYAFDPAGVERYLRVPPRQPDYRAGRAHAEFIRNVPLGGAELRRRLRAGWQAEDPMREWPAERVRRLVEEKYALAEWIRRR
jgi:lipoate-protein ligase A